MKSTTDVTRQLDQDARDLERLGYVQELLREMGGFSNFAISFSVISILTGAIQLYGYGLQHGGPLQITFGWIFVSVFTLFVALSMAELASSYPTSGALYHWSSFLGGRAWGWFTAAFNTIGQFTILAGIDFGLAQLILGLGGWNASTFNTNLLYIALLVSHAGLNHIGIRVVTKLNDFSAWYHIGVVLLLLGALLSKGFAQPPSFLLTFHSSDGFSPAYSFLIGLLLAQWTLTGYDASAHTSEETVDPRHHAPRGVFMSVVISIIFGFLMLVAITLSIPDLKQASDFGANAFTEILKLRLGVGFGTTVVALVLGAMWLCGLSSMTSASRMVYAFARDGGLPFSPVWGRVSSKYKTPASAIWGLMVLAMVLALVVAVFCKDAVDAFNDIVSMAVIALYISYGLPIAARLYARWKGGIDERGPWDLKKMSTPVAFVAVLWICFICVVFVLPPNEIAGKVMAGFFVLVLLIWFGLARKRFAGPKYHPTGNGQPTGTVLGSGGGDG